jgi:hypothetical protein
METRIPVENSKETMNARFVEIFPCPLMNPIISGMLAIWQGLKTMLSMPQTKEAPIAISGALSIARVRTVKICSIISPLAGCPPFDYRMVDSLIPRHLISNGG